MSLRMRLRNLKLRKERWAYQREWSRYAKESTLKKNMDIVNEWWAEHSWEINAVEEELRHNDSRALLDKAEKLYLPRPEYSDADKWVREDELLTPQSHWHILTPQARFELQASIRKEKRERREVWEWCLKMAGAGLALATGLIGSITGLIATLHSAHR
jgi:hypothetical protein